MWATRQAGNSAEFAKKDDPLTDGWTRNGATLFQQVAGKYIKWDNGAVEMTENEKWQVHLDEEQARLDAEAAAVIAANEQAAQDEAQRVAAEQAAGLEAVRLQAVHGAYNEYILFCDHITGSNTHTILTIPELKAIGAQIAVTDPQMAKDANVKLLTIDAELKTLDGLDWFDRCKWTEEI